MEYRKFLIAAAMAAAALPAPASAAPVNAANDADGRALILVPLTITKIQDLDFGSVVPSASSGIVALDASTSARTFTGGIVGVTGDPGHRGYFGGAGSPGQLVVVSVTAPTELASAAGDKIPVLAMTLDGPPLRTIDPTTRSFFIGVGGIIVLAPNQPEGLYEATFTVTANYT